MERAILPIHSSIQFVKFPILSTQLSSPFGNFELLFSQGEQQNVSPCQSVSLSSSYCCCSSIFVYHALCQLFKQLHQIAPQKNFCAAGRTMLASTRRPIVGRSYVLQSVVKQMQLARSRVCTIGSRHFAASQFADSSLGNEIFSSKTVKALNLFQMHGFRNGLKSCLKISVP